ncbi:MAG TPA: hypothetical protein VJ739_05825, partial [Gemmataceae bacterium]|nr:hypothetical protein [Gemmataceae bacterium]
MMPPSAETLRKHEAPGSRRPFPAEEKRPCPREGRTNPIAPMLASLHFIRRALGLIWAASGRWMVAWAT